MDREKEGEKDNDIHARLGNGGKRDQHGGYCTHQIAQFLRRDVSPKSPEFLIQQVKTAIARQNVGQKSQIGKRGSKTGAYGYFERRNSQDQFCSPRTTKLDMRDDTIQIQSRLKFGIHDPTRDKMTDMENLESQ